MAADDFLVYILDKRYGLWGSQVQNYQHWTGRYTATFILYSLTHLNIPARFYYLHTLVLLVSMTAAYFYLLAGINTRLLGKRFSFIRLLQVSLILLLITLYTQAEISTGFYWFSSSLTYQPPFIFSLFIAGLLIRGGADQIRWKYLLPAVLLVIATCGTTEIGPLYLFLSLLVIAAFFYKVTDRIPRAIIICLLVTLIDGIFIMLTCGLFTGRAKLMNEHTGLTSILPMVVFRWASVFYYILRVPGFWVVGFLLYGLGLQLSLREDNRLALSPWGGRRILAPGLFAIAACVFLSLAPILFVTKGSFPTRSLDTLVDLTAFSVIALLFISGTMDTKTALLFERVRVPSAAPLLLLILTLMATDPLIEAWESVFSGYFYHGVAEQRKQQIQEAKAQNQRVIRIKPIAVEVEDKIREKFPNGIFETIHAMLLEKPVLIYDDNGMEKSDSAVCQYYGLDSIIVKNPQD